MYNVCGVSRGKGIEPESCIGRVLSSVRSWLGLVAGAGTMLGQGRPGRGQCDNHTDIGIYAPTTGLITSSGPDKCL